MGKQAIEMSRMENPRKTNHRKSTEWNIQENFTCRVDIHKHTLTNPSTVQIEPALFSQLESPIWFHVLTLNVLLQKRRRGVELTMSNLCEILLNTKQSR